MNKNRIYSSKTFRYNQDFSTINFRKHPELYQVGRGEQGVLLVEPYKSEILPYWRFKTALIAKKSSKEIHTLFLGYKKKSDFVGMDMARKFLQMGYTRARRYANHASGKKYVSNPQKESTKKREQEKRKDILKQSNNWKNGEKAQAARIFYSVYVKARQDPLYIQMKKHHQETYG